VVGLDIGKLQNHTALALLRWRHTRPSSRCLYDVPYAPRPEVIPQAERRYEVATLKRWPLQQSYLSIGRELVKYLQQPFFRGAPLVLAADATGVGQAVCEMIGEEIDKARIPGWMVRVTITGGSAVTLDPHVPGAWRVAKKELVSILRRLLGTGRLAVEPTLPEAKQLAHELGTFQVSISEATKNESFEAFRERDQDDLVLAAAIATWAAETITDVFGPPPE
jgi:hypothetical protein